MLFRSAIQATDFQKGLGPDRFNGMALLQNEELLKKVAEELVLMLNFGTIPEYLKEARVVALSKVRGTSEVEADDIRFIAMRSHLSKVIEKAILAKLREDNSAILAVGSYQRGFKEGASTAENITFALNSLFGNGAIKKKNFCY